MQVETKTVENTLQIPLINGRIEGKSGVSLQKLVDSMDTNLQRVLVNIVLEKVGINISTDGGFYEVDSNKVKAYVQWLQKREEFTKKFKITKKYAIAEKL
jgi:hypothetical protein